MKICLINNLYSPWERGGAEKIVSLTAKGLSRSGHDVFVIATSPEETKSDNVYFLKSIFYNLSSYPLWRRFFWHVGGLLAWNNTKKIKAILAKEKPDLVITHNLIGVGLSLPRLLKKNKQRHFHVLHDIQLLHPSGLMFWGKEWLIDAWPARFYQRIVRFLFGSPEVVISPSSWLLSEHEKRGFFKDSNRLVMPNFLKDRDVISEDAQRPSAPGKTGKFVFLFVGQLEPHKGVDFLAKTWLSVSETLALGAAELVLVGDGSLSKGLFDSAASSGGRLKVAGRRTTEEVADLMRLADCLIVPSLCYENSPTVIYEAIAAGLPVLAADIGGIGELVEKFDGWLFRPGDAADLADKMAMALSSPAALAAISAKEKDFEPGDYFDSLKGLIGPKRV